MYLSSEFVQSGFEPCLFLAFSKPCGAEFHNYMLWGKVLLSVCIEANLL